MRSIMAISDNNVHESTRLYGFLDSSCRSSQIFPTSNSKNPIHSVHYYIVNKKISEKEPLHLEQLN